MPDIMSDEKMGPHPAAHAILNQPSHFNAEFFGTAWQDDGGLKIPSRALTEEEEAALCACVRFKDDVS